MSSENGAQSAPAEEVVLSEAEQSVRKSKDEAAAREILKNVEHKILVESGQAINTKEAMLRCFDGSHGTESLRGGGPL